MHSTSYLDIHLRSAATFRSKVLEDGLAKVVVEDGQLNLSIVCDDPAPLLQLAAELTAAADRLQAVKAGAA